MDRTDGIEELYAYLKQIKQRMETLENENLVLRAQLAESQRELMNLRRGFGITLVINGQPVTPMPLPDAMPPPVAALQTIAATPGNGSPGLFSPSATPVPSANGAPLFGQPREQRPTRPEMRNGNDYIY